MQSYRLPVGKWSKRAAMIDDETRADPGPNPRPDPGTTNLPSGGIWTFVDGVAVAADLWAVGPATMLVPAEAVLMLSVELPLASRAQRAAALPFAVEDRIADPIELVHVALGEEIAPRCYVAGVVRHAVMQGWMQALAAAGLDDAAIVPDALALPAPESGAWSIAAAAGRILVRTDAGTGFAVPQDRFLAVWSAGGQMPCVIHGAALPFGLPMSVMADAAAGPGPLLRPALDMRQGPYAAASRPMPVALRRLGLILVAGLLAQTAIAAADTLKLRGVARERRATAEALVRTVMPGTAMSDDIDRLLSANVGLRGRFLPLLGRTAAALAPVGGLTLQTLGYADGDGALTLGVEAADIGALQRARTALAAAGLNPVSGAATAGSGRADGEIVVRGAAS